MKLLPSSPSSPPALSPGFTLLELLIVAVIIGVLTALALPLFGRAQEEAYVATMKHDLRSYVTAHALYRADHDDLPHPESLAGYALSTGVEVIRYEDSPAHWHMMVGHRKTPRTCMLTVGTLPSGRQATGRITCDDDPHPDLESFRIGYGWSLPVLVGVSHEFDAGLTASPWGIQSYEWVIDGQSYQGRRVHHTFSSPGTYQIFLRARDGQGTVLELDESVLVEFPE